MELASITAMCRRLTAVTCVVLVSLVSFVHSSAGLCPPRHFNRDSLECIPCSSCPLNHIIRKPCTTDNDTVCGPFYEFEFFNQGPHTMEEWKVEHPQPSELVATGDSIESLQDVFVDTSPTKGPSVHSDTGKWKELCFGLIGALVVVSVFALIYIIFNQYRARRGYRKANRIQDPEDAVVYYETQMESFNNPRLAADVKKNLPHIERQLKMKEYKERLYRLFHPGARFVNVNEYVDQLSQSRGPFLLGDNPESTISGNDVPTSSTAGVHQSSSFKEMTLTSI